MNMAFTYSVFFVCVTTVIVLTLGDPDLLDAIIGMVMASNG